ncbi:hypothetical protein F5884DRAFT_853856 [Xylogone sp. PMI_703]|nr:hypothetical protein F5884DRAFT_853856 [Xylogone sp. PMI_703]
MEATRRESISDAAESSQTKRVTASQACERCRARKTRCDEKRPRCSLCERMDMTCVYREPKPTKKDQTLVMILQQLELLNHKVDGIGSRFEQAAADNPTTAEERGADWVPTQIPHRQVPSAGSLPMSSDRPNLSSFAIPHTVNIEGHNILTWAAVRDALGREIGELPYKEGMEAPSAKWLADVSEIYSTPVTIDPRIDIISDGTHGPFSPSRSVYLAQDRIYEWCLTYFHSFHCMFPIIDRATFETILLPRCQQHSFDENDEASALVLLVMTLGILAEEGTIGKPLTGAHTGMIGGTVERPPGHIFLHEAMRRMGVMLSHHTMISLQCHILCAIYFAQCSKNMEYWRMTQLSCTICRNLVLMTYGWGTFESDMISRLFWMCMVLESGPVGELGLKRSALFELQDSIPLPSFTTATGDLPETDRESFLQYHFLAQITLRSLIDRINSALKIYRNPFETESTFTDALVQELFTQLQRWRNHLPLPLQWTHATALEVSPELDDPAMIILKSDGIIYCMINVDLILTASLQTRYKYTEYLIWRPYIYKALHSEALVTDQDLRGCERAILACTQWPLTLPLFQERKRLLPHLFEYSHTFFGILVLLHICSSSKIIRPLLDVQETHDLVEISQTLLLQWLSDMKSAHPVAKWGWQLIRLLYADHVVVKTADDLDLVEMSEEAIIETT